MRKFVLRVLSFVMSVVMAAGILPAGGLRLTADAAENIVIAGVDIGYADGDYFTKNGGSCNNSYWSNGRCHNNGVCVDSTHPQCNCMRYWPTGNPKTCQVDLRSTQCLGFARFCQWKVYGNFDLISSGNYTDITGKISASNCTASNLKSKLLGCAPATHVRSGDDVHSISIVSTSDYGAEVADCNSNGRCIVKLKSYSWSELATYLKNKSGIKYAYANKSGTASHVHNYSTEGYETAHPHKVYKACSCGDLKYTGETKKISTCLTCYPASLSVYFNANGGSVSSDTYKLSSDLVYIKSDSTKYCQNWTYNNAQEDGLTDASELGVYRVGFAFAGWGTEPAGGTVFARNDSTLKPSDICPDIASGSCSITLYAQWKANTYSIAFNGNGSTSGSMSKLSMAYGTAKNLTANAFVKSGYTFIGWNTKADGSGISYADKASVKNMTATNGTTVTLYAQWRENSVVTAYTLTYNANGGSGAPSAVSGAVSYTVSSTVPVRSGYKFLGWSKSPTATVESYKGGDMITLTENTVIYAVWVKIPSEPSSVEVEIREPSRTAVSYGDSLILHADLSKELPAGWKIEWAADNGCFKYTVSDDGLTCTITPENSGATSFTATVYDGSGKEISSDTQAMTSKAGIIDLLIAFIKTLFSLSQIYPQSINGIF